MSGSNSIIKNKIKYKGLDNSICYVSALTEHVMPNSEYEVHAHYDDFEIYYVTQGDMFFAFEGRRFPIENNTLIVICNGTLHRPIFRSECCFERTRVIFNKNVFSYFNTVNFELYNRLRKKKILVLGPKEVKENQLVMLLDEIKDALALGTPYGDFQALISLFSLLIKAEKNSQKNLAVFDNFNEKTSEIVEYIDKHLAENLSYKTLAKHFHISEKNLYKIFTKETGFTLGDYITERRIIKSQTILNAGGSASEAAFATGFKDYSVFYRNFLQKVGVSPSKYIQNRNQPSNT